MKLTFTKANTATKQEDRLSPLPDSILRHILSFMPTKYAARTSVLSTKWKNLFLGVPNIDLKEEKDESESETESEEDSRVSQPQSCRNNERKSFIDFVNRRLMLNGISSITEFRLKCREFPEGSVSNLWLTALLLRNVQVLEIELLQYHPEAHSLCPPRGVFQSEPIVVLKLSGANIVVKIPAFVCLPNLKVLHLKYVDMQFESGNFELAEGFPLLEDLRLDGVNYPNNAVVGISLPKLRRLAFIIIPEERLKQIKVDSPHLQHLEYVGGHSLIIQFNLVSCESLISAKFSLLWKPFYYQGSQWLVKLLSEGHKIKVLHLSETILKGITRWPYVDSLPVFPHLMHLELAAELTAIGVSMWTLFLRSPNLEEFDFEMSDCSIFHPPEDEPVCLTQELREISVRRFKGTESEFAAVKYFLMHGAVLERMIIEPSNDKMEWPVSILRQLLKLERRSPKCKIELG